HLDIKLYPLNIGWESTHKLFGTSLPSYIDKAEFLLR
ncbi:hypothetical protein EVA_19016, partial [gut metagenome]